MSSFLFLSFFINGQYTRRDRSAGGADDQSSCCYVPASCVSASVFKNDGNSDTTYFNVSIQNRYKNKETGEWKDSKSLLRDQLPVLEHLIRQAYAYILDQESARPAQEAE